jgi:hypothetical protein
MIGGQGRLRLLCTRHSTYVSSIFLIQQATHIAPQWRLCMHSCTPILLLENLTLEYAFSADFVCPSNDNVFYTRNGENYNME